MNQSTLAVTNLLSSLLFGGFAVLGTAISQRMPVVAYVMVIVMIGMGAGELAYGLVAMGRYRETFDYEPTMLWGRACNGKTARAKLTAINAAGMWCLLSGLALLMLLVAIPRVVGVE